MVSPAWRDRLHSAFGAIHTIHQAARRATIFFPSESLSSGFAVRAESTMRHTHSSPPLLAVTTASYAVRIGPHSDG